MNKVLVVLLVALSSGVAAQTPVKVWETEPVFSGPESVAYDAKREVLYVSNLRRTRKSDAYYGGEFVSRVNLDGEVVDLKWIDGLSEPTGIVIFNDRLYIVERFGVVTVNLETGRIVNRIRIEDQSFINDIDVAPDGTVFVSDSDTETIYAIKGGEVRPWYSGPAISHTNGVLVNKGRLLVAANTDAAIKSIDLASKQVTEVASIIPGIIDGIRPIGADILVSRFEGQLYRVTGEGGVSEVLDTGETGVNIADFEYIEDKNLLVVPALWQHKLIAYELK